MLGRCHSPEDQRSKQAKPNQAKPKPRLDQAKPRLDLVKLKPSQAGLTRLGLGYLRPEYEVHNYLPRYGGALTGVVGGALTW